MIVTAFEVAEVEFIEENGEGRGVSLPQVLTGQCSAPIVHSAPDVELRVTNVRHSDKETLRWKP